MACQLYNIGKIDLPERLLLSQGKFSDADLGKIKPHTTIDAEILSNSLSAIPCG
jgi:response regulator RpfG family c-di-GMP phosphodiesterase